MSYSILLFDKSMLNFLPHKQQPFDIIGRLVPKYDGSEWKTAEQLFEQKSEKIYIDDFYNPLDYIDNPDQAAYLAMFNSECIGSIRVCKRWNGNGFIDDLTINRIHRHQGVGRILMDAAVQWCKRKSLNGLSLETQDKNLLACRFYIKYGFKLGGIDTKVYTHPSYREEIALYFYLPDELY